MEPIEQPMDVSWMTSSKDKLSTRTWNDKAATPQDGPVPGISPSLQSTTASAQDNSKSTRPSPQSPQRQAQPATSTRPESPRPTPGTHSRPAVAGGSVDDKSSKAPNAPGTSLGRRGSWFSNLSSKLSGSAPASQPGQTAATSHADADEVAPLPKMSPNKNAVLPHAARQSGDGPYTPAPPRSAQPGILGVFRRLSSSSGSNTPTGKNNHGLVERRVLNVDKTRERSRLAEVPQSKLRRVAFCVDVEIAPMPKYHDAEAPGHSPDKSSDAAQKRKASEKSEGEVLKGSKEVEFQHEDGLVQATTGEEVNEQPEQERNAAPSQSGRENRTEPAEEPKSEREVSRKKEKKKKSEAERKAKKEAKRREALERGAIPMEIRRDSDTSVEDMSAIANGATVRPQLTPTTMPGRIYRRCCQLRETEILTKVTKQLPKTVGGDGLVEKLDLSGYVMTLAELVTLGDFLAVVPVREVILEKCGLTDEGVRVVLGGLLAAKKANTRQTRSVTNPADIIRRGGVVERLVLKDNKIGVEGWKHICLFIHMCRSVKVLDISSIQFPSPCEPLRTPLSHHHFHLHHHAPSNGQTAAAAAAAALDVSRLLAKSLAERLAGSELELLNLGETGMSTSQLGAIIDGIIKSGVSRLGLARNDIDAQGMAHVARYLRAGHCQGLDLGGNNMRDQLGTLADAISEDSPLWALSLANCNLGPSSLCRLFSKLAKLKNFKFLDLSHNHDLCQSEPSAIALLRRFLPQMKGLRRLHLADVAMSSEQAIALAEIIPEIDVLAHVNLLENPKLVLLADARTEEKQEEACALYASLLAAARVSDALVKIDIENPTPESGEIVKALANQVVAYCLYNMRLGPDLGDPTSSDKLPKDLHYPEVLRHIVGFEEDSAPGGMATEVDPAPNGDYVIGGTGVVKALACCLKNRGDESSGQASDVNSGSAAGTVDSGAYLPSSKARVMSKHLLASARKIRVRLQPALARAKAAPSSDIHHYNRLLFLDQTIGELIKRFEDEFPETREEGWNSHQPSQAAPSATEQSSTEDTEPVFLSDTEDIETELRSTRSRSASMLSHTSRALAEEEGRALRVGQQFRRGLLRQEHYYLLTGAEDIGDNPEHTALLTSLLDEIDDADIKRQLAEKGAARTFQDAREELIRKLRDKDPVHWDRFVESQEKARANMQLAVNGNADGNTATSAKDEAVVVPVEDDAGE